VGGTAAGARNVISGNAVYGVAILNAGTSGNVVAGNRIGTDAAGMVALANVTGVRIELSASDNTVGGTAAGSGNLISGNTGPGVQIDNTASGNVVAGNQIGTDSTGEVALANSNGVLIEIGATDNTVGGTAAGAGNLISGNTGSGVLIELAATANVVAGNQIGSDAAGTVALANNFGVVIESGAAGNTVGGSIAAARNVISGNSNSGVSIDGASDNLVAGNFVGTNQAGTAEIANNPNGGTFAGGVSIVNGSAGNTIGGLTASPGTGAGNLISGNAYAGIEMAYAGTNNVVAGNLVGTDVTGTVAIPNTLVSGVAGGDGVRADYSPGNAVGEPGGKNVLSGNANDGVLLIGSSGTTVQNNDIGTDITGTVAVPNSNSGVEIIGSYTIGGLTSTPGTGLGNVISGNLGPGLSIGGNPASDQVAIEGNIIGADASGMHELPNYAGISLYASQSVTIGGITPGAGNLISGNNESGGYGDIRLDSASVMRTP
jgi:titin